MEDISYRVVRDDDMPPAELLELLEQHGPRGVVVLVDLVGGNYGKFQGQF